MVIEATGKLLQEVGPNLPDDILTVMTAVASLDPELAKAPAFRQRGLRIGFSDSLPTRYHYNQMQLQLKKKGIRLVAMQYPTIEVEGLRSHFKDSHGILLPDAKDIVFVSNRENFLTALESKKYEELFVDRFRGSWGHTTDLGHEMIADSVLAAILPLIEDLSPSSNKMGFASP
jgi:hypothetical protein